MYLLSIFVPSSTLPSLPFAWRSHCLGLLTTSWQGRTVQHPLMDRTKCSGVGIVRCVAPGGWSCHLYCNLPRILSRRAGAGINSEWHGLIPRATGIFRRIIPDPAPALPDTVWDLTQSTRGGTRHNTTSRSMVARVCGLNGVAPVVSGWDEVGDGPGLVCVSWGIRSASA
jgi:hypothetical protein